MMIVVLQKKIYETQGLQSKFHELNIFISNIYLLSLLLYNSSIVNIEHTPYYIVLGSSQTHKGI